MVLLKCASSLSSGISEQNGRGCWKQLASRKLLRILTEHNRSGAHRKLQEGATLSRSLPPEADLLTGKAFLLA